MLLVCLSCILAYYLEPWERSIPLTRRFSFFLRKCGEGGAPWSVPIWNISPSSSFTGVSTGLLVGSALSCRTHFLQLFATFRRELLFRLVSWEEMHLGVVVHTGLLRLRQCSMRRYGGGQSVDDRKIALAWMCHL